MISFCDIRDKSALFNILCQNETIKDIDREGWNKEKLRKCREWISLHFLILSLFPPSLSISYIKICHILSQNIKYGDCHKKTEHTLFEEIILVQIRCEETPQVVPAC